MIARMTRRLAYAALALVMLALAACASSPSGSANKRDLILSGYGTAVRWSDWDAAQDFLDPVQREEHPLTELEQERYKQFEVTSYQVRSIAMAPDEMSLHQRVELRLVNRNTQIERELMDNQHWVYDPVAKSWWLASGLPDLDDLR